MKSFFKKKSFLFVFSVLFWILSLFVAFFIKLPSLKGYKLLNSYEILNFYDLLFNNLKVILLILMGSFCFGITSLTNLFLNGLILGFFINLSLANDKSVAFVILKTIPHFFEYIALWTASAVALENALNIANHKKNQMFETLGLYMIICFFETFIAAVMEYVFVFR